MAMASHPHDAMLYTYIKKFDIETAAMINNNRRINEPSLLIRLARRVLPFSSQILLIIMPFTANTSIMITIISAEDI